MKQFFRNIIIFILFLFVFTEIVSRVFHVSYNMPKMYKHPDGLLKFTPNQIGYFDGGKHKWYINKLGLPGKELPELNNNLITIIGDSYILNLMNPDSCRQQSYLRKIKPQYSYLESARDGATLLEYFEMAKKLDTLNPKLQLIYVNTSDFLGCFSNNPYDVRLDTVNNKLIYSKFMDSKLKLLIPYLNFTEYLYRKNAGKLLMILNNKPKVKHKNTNKIKNKLIINRYKLVLTYIKVNYKTENIVFIFHSTVSDEIVNIVNNFEIKNFKIQKNIDSWIIKNDIHWTCEAHNEIAKQVSGFLDELVKNE